MYITVLPENIEAEVPDQADLAYWAESFAIDVPVLSDGSGWGYDLEPNETWPNVLILDRQMKVFDRRVEPVEEAAIIAQIEAALTE
jgi:hypothetical protein